jgi:hypothetical protein
MSGDEDIPIFYLYHRQPDGRPFYLNAAKETTSWRPPLSGMVYNPETLAVIPREELPSSKSKRKHRPRVQYVNLHLPPSVETDAARNTLDDLASSHFRPVKGVSNAELTKFHTKKISAPLLAAVAKASTKKAVAMFESLLIYAKTISSKKPITLQQMVEFANDPSLILKGEFYVQLLKQLNGCPVDAQALLLDLLTVITSTTVPPPEIIPFVRSELARLVKRAPESLKDRFNFAYVRFLHISSASENPFKPIPTKTLVSAATTATNQFGVTLYETMWNQRTRHPNMPFPYILHYTETVFWAKQCEHQVGIFRKPGNMQLVDTLIKRANTDDVGFLQEAEPDDVGSFYKKWFRDIPGGLVNADRTKELYRLKRGQYIEFADSLEPLVKNVLKHLIGFLKQVAVTAEETMMDVQNLAMVFGPGLVCEGNAADPAMAKGLQVASNCIQELIGGWDVSDMLPFKP